MDFADLLHPDVWVALVSLSAMEIVLGIDNIVFLSILVAKVPAESREKIRKVGLLLALGMRIGLLLTLSWMMKLTQPLFHVAGFDPSGRDLILLVGGLFLIGKSAHEVHGKIEGARKATEDAVASDVASVARPSAGVTSVLVQIVLIDIVFSLDSVITAVGMAQEIWVMVAAMCIAVGSMLVFARPVGDFVERHPSVKILALTFLMLIGVLLVAEGFGQHISKGYIYFAMAYALFVEFLNMRFRGAKPKAPQPAPDA
ncbi:MAG TPA: TerC family protein [Polyangiaceae bacterium]|nr:TerC family protein [Polyangiaceae bacterium]